MAVVGGIFAAVGAAGAFCTSHGTGYEGICATLKDGGGILHGFGWNAVGNIVGNIVGNAGGVVEWIGFEFWTVYAEF
jgi:hypothetical protein